MQEDSQLLVHPAISWLQFDSEHLQIRVPDGQHITLEERANETRQILEMLSQPHSYEATIAWADSQNIDRDIVDTVLSTLNDYSMIVETNHAHQSGLPGVFRNVLDFNINASKALRSGLAFPYFNQVEVVGDCDIQAMVADSAAEVETFLMAQTTGSERRPIRIVCTVTGDQQFLRKQNQQAVAEKVAMLPIQWSDDMFTIGPLYIPDESACYECLTIRRRASSNYLAELDGWLSSAVQRSHTPKFDRPMQNLIGFAVSRYLLIVGCGMFHLIKPNEVESWDVIKAEKKIGEVLKVPRCGVCGRKKASDPTRAIRDLNS
ncbi:hypothetical protein Q3O60_02860 [Alkalimonas collagenimarina]|uniref:TOMM leader peptide-binding protein n=1 Tax=Alkalimonas collagenimarina TaxID=400390 RepID=A0ABT9GVP6_9GAMM|nr:hypothetical protein [Alkalimonas collagenimarina]MDP4535126.1 hypothetical protein [Alkalimonas collagenimarina]